MRPKPKSNVPAGGRQAVRIIGGQWRSRKISFPDVQQLRPTPDRVRVTLFNWLMPLISGARCLDLFAGSGVLGMEALSRGAASAVLVEQQPDIAANLREQLNLLKATEAHVVVSDALTYLRHCTGQFDIVFLDPPYDSELLLLACELLEQRGLLQPDARIYLETRDAAVLAQLPVSWQVLRSKRAGQVSYHLLQRAAPVAMVN